MMQQDKVPRLSGIAKEPVNMKAEGPTANLLALFQERQDLPLVALQCADGYLDCVSRKALLNLMTRPFAKEIYGKKPVATLLESLPQTALVLKPDTDVNAAAIELLSVDPTLQTDAFPLVEDGLCVGMVAVPDLMLAVAEQQKSLLRELDLLSSRLREEVALATKIQQDLLPVANQAFSGVTVAGGNSTSSEIGGDFYDYFAIGEHKVGVLIADVSGHGVQAGMVTTAAKASLHTLLATGVATPSGLLAGMNNAILQTARQTLLMTCLIACIDTENDTMTLANAGHNFPYLLRPGSPPRMLDETVGFPLGFERDSIYPESSFPLHAGDALFMYTDGLVECQNVEGEELGYERMTALLHEAVQSVAPAALHRTLLAGATRFTGTSRFEDDVTTVLALRNRAAGETGAI